VSCLFVLDQLFSLLPFRFFQTPFLKSWCNIASEETVIQDRSPWSASLSAVFHENISCTHLRALIFQVLPYTWFLLPATVFPTSSLTTPFLLAWPPEIVPHSACVWPSLRDSSPGFLPAAATSLSPLEIRVSYPALSTYTKPWRPADATCMGRTVRPSPRAEALAGRDGCPSQRTTATLAVVGMREQPALPSTLSYEEANAVWAGHQTGGMNLTAGMRRLGWDSCTALECVSPAVLALHRLTAVRSEGFY